jgi:hypothetical protein
LFELPTWWVFEESNILSNGRITARFDDFGLHGLDTFPMSMECPLEAEQLQSYEDAAGVEGPFSDSGDVGSSHVGAHPDFFLSSPLPDSNRGRLSSESDA